MKQAHTSLISQRKFQIAFYLFLALGVVLCSSSAWAFRFSPLEAEINPTSDSLSYAFTIENPTDKKVAIQAQAFLREQNEKGEEKRTPTKDISVYPEQAVIEPGETRTLRISWKGDRKTTSEIPYRLQVEQIPVDFDRSKKIIGSHLGFFLSYMASVYVTPPLAASKLEITLEKRKSGYALAIQNSGSKHKVLTGADVFVADATGNEIKLGPNELKNLDLENVLAGQKRVFELPTLKIGDGPYKTRIEFNRKK